MLRLSRKENSFFESVVRKLFGCLLELSLDRVRGFVV